jgi:hypothetical protein
MYNGPQLKNSEENIYFGRLIFNNNQSVYLDKEIFLIGRNKSCNLVVNVYTLYNISIIAS